MKALYDKDAKLIGWMLDKQYIWDTDFEYVAFVMNDFVFSVKSLHWIGGFEKHTLIDRDGFPVAHEQNHEPKSSMSMISPSASLSPPPPTPYRQWVPETLIPPPLPPLKGWSRLTWAGWLRQ